MKERAEAEVLFLEAERWAKKRFPEELSSALGAVGEAAKNVKSRTIIPLKVAKDELKDRFLEEMVIGELKKMGFGIYYRLSDGEPKIKEYCLTWGLEINNEKEPEGFIPLK